MAKWIARRSRLSQEYARILRKTYVAYFFFVALFLSFFVLSIRQFAWWQLSLLVLSAVSFGLAKSTQKDRGIYGQGLRGEKQVFRILKKLSSECIVAPNLRIGKGRRYEVDALVCTRGAVSIIEVKHYKGKIEKVDGRWLVSKTNYKKAIANPIEQLEDRMYCARQLLDHNGAKKALVRGVLVFAGDTLVDTAQQEQLKTEKVEIVFLSRGETKTLLKYLGTHGPAAIPAEKLYEALVGK
ncbi:NERD domain-containing protein [Clostridia bacterium]|nr:NERD domain-containing protein [Clostridia bacterium]